MSNTTFTAVVSTDHLKQALTSVSVLVDECKLNLTQQGFKISAVDPANVGMTTIELSTAAFESYTLDTENNNGLTIGVNLDRFGDVIGMADTGQLAHFRLDPKTRKLHITIDGLEYTLALIDPDAIRQEPDLPDLDLSAEVHISPQDIDRAITAADMVADHIALGVDPDESLFYASAEGDTDDVHIELNEETLIDLSPGDAHSLFSLDYLKDINKAFRSADELQLTLDIEHPVMFEYEFADQTGTAVFMLAPRIQSD